MPRLLCFLRCFQRRGVTAVTLAACLAGAGLMERALGDDDEEGIEEIATAPPRPQIAPSSRPLPPRPAKPEAELATLQPPVVEEEKVEAQASVAEEVEASEVREEPATPPVRGEWGSAPDNAPEPRATGRPIPFNSVIHSVDESAPLFTMGRKKIRIVHVTTATRFYRVDGRPATFEALEPGVEVRGSARKLAQSEWEAVSLYIGSKAAAETGTLED